MKELESEAEWTTSVHACILPILASESTLLWRDGITISGSWTEAQTSDAAQQKWDRRQVSSGVSADNASPSIAPGLARRVDCRSNGARSKLTLTVRAPYARNDPKDAQMNWPSTFPCVQRPG
jgi:hypothetical protein